MREDLGQRRLIAEVLQARAEELMEMALAEIRRGTEPEMLSAGAILTGGAKGIGRDTALRFLAEGGRLAVIDQEPGDGDLASRLRDDAGESGRRLAYLQGDVTGNSVLVAKTVDDIAEGQVESLAIAFAVIVAAAATGLVVPAIAALLAVTVDAYGVRAGARLLRRIALRLPANI